MSDRLRDLLIKHEGVRLKPYTDSVGKLTIGCGRNLDDLGITEREALVLLENDIVRTRREVSGFFPWFKDLDEVRQDVMINMAFNLGLPRLLGFQKMLVAVKHQDWEEAAKQMLDSKWAEQVGSRALELSNMMRMGKYADPTRQP